MTISFSGLGSGLDTASWVEALAKLEQAKIDKVSAKKTTEENAYSTLKTLKTSYSTLQSKLEVFTDARFGTSMNVFAKNVTTSTDETTVTASATNSATRQTLDISIERLASSTKAVSSTDSGNVGSTIDSDTVFASLSSGSAKIGSFSLFVNNKLNTITIGEQTTLGEVVEQINAIDGAAASITDGKFSITATDSNTVSVGATADSSNFYNIMALEKDTLTGNYESSRKISELNQSAALISADAGIATAIESGSSFKIGNATFEIGDETSLGGLIYQINNSEDAGVSAYWDATADKLILTAKNEGSFNINIEDVTGNFTAAMGLTAHDGSDVSRIKEGSQTLGNTALLTINGTSLTSTSNTVTSDISGIEGLTLNLKGTTETGKTTHVTIAQDQKSVLAAAKDFVAALNSVLSETDSATAVGGNLNGETSLNSIRNQLRSLTSSGYTENSVYRTLASVGISTGEVGKTTIESETDQFYLDEKQFLKALTANPDEVEKLFVAQPSSEGSTQQGIMNKLESVVDTSLNASSGYFASRATSYTQKIERYDDTISKMEDDLENYKARLTTKFQLMDELISKLNDQYSTFSSMISSLSS